MREGEAMPDRWWFLIALLFLAAGALAQDDDDEEPSIEMDAEPEVEDEPSAEPTRKPAGPRPARAPGAKPKWVPHQAQDYTFKLPDDWGVRPEKRDDTIYAADLRLPGARGNSFLTIVHVKDLMDPRGAPFYYRDGVQKNRKNPRVERGYDPLPHIVLQHERNGKEEVAVWAFHKINGNGIQLLFECIKDDFEIGRKDFLAAAASLTGKPKPWPPVPKGYKVERKGNFLFAIHSSVRMPVAPMMKVAATAEKRFKSFHGSLPKPDRPFVIYFHTDKFQAKPILASVADAKSDWYVDSRDLRVFAKPFTKTDLDSAGLFVGAVHGMLFVARYGLVEPHWVHVGEEIVARVEHMTGRKLPSMHAGFVNWRVNLPVHPLGTLIETRTTNYESYSKQALFYVCTFRAGKYKSAYKRFLKEYASNPDWEAAYERHLASIDPAELSADVQKTMWSRLKEIKPKD